MSTAYLNLNLSQEVLEEIYADTGEKANYYWYLHCKEFRKTFLEPLSSVLLTSGGPTLDVCCGTGWLADYMPAPFYVGFDGSNNGIDKAQVAHPKYEFHVARLCETPEIERDISNVLFGNVFSVLVRPEHVVDFIRLYLDAYNPLFFTVYELQRFDTTPIDNEWELKWEYSATADVPEIEDVKRHRQIKVYKC